jgi:hypothetical protein
MINEQNTQSLGKEATKWDYETQIVVSYLLGKIADQHKTIRVLTKRLLEK